jgi:hypothetical protein
MESLARLHNPMGSERELWLMNVCLIAKTSGMGINQVIECLSIYGNDLPMVEQLYEDVNNRSDALMQQEYQSRKRV